MTNPVNRKDQRNKNIRRYRQKHPELSLQDIGRKYHISPQRVSTILDHNREEKAYARKYYRERRKRPVQLHLFAGHDLYPVSQVLRKGGGNGTQ